MRLERKIRVEGGFAFDILLPPNPNDEVPTLRFVECDFQPVDPSNPDSPHVADVPSERIAVWLISAAPETYAPYKDSPRED